MPFDFGPEPIQWRGYGGHNVRPFPRAGVLPPSSAVDFYQETRARAKPGRLSTVCVALPAVVFGIALALAGLLLSGAPFPLALDLADQPPLAQALFGAFCASDVANAPLADALAAAVAHFTWAHVALLAACGLAYVGGATATKNVLRVHGMGELSACRISFGAPIVAGVALDLIAHVVFGPTVAGAFARLAPFPVHDASKPLLCLGPAFDIASRLFWQAELAIGLVSVAVSALILAAAVIAWRFNIDDIDGAWADSYVLRHKLKSLLTLFFVASLLLVVSNVALSALTDVKATVLAEAETALSEAAAAQAGAAPASTCLILCFAAAPAAAQAEAQTSANPPSIKESLAEMKSLRSALVNFAGAIGSLLLLSIFVPAFYSLTGDIEIAGKTHASADMAPRPTADPDGWITLVKNAADPPVTLFQVSSNVAPAPSAAAPPTPYPVAGWKTVQEWKDRHGLAVTFAQMTGSFVAVLAPILTGSVLDVTKALVGG